MNMTSLKLYMIVQDNGNITEFDGNITECVQDNGNITECVLDNGNITEYVQYNGNTTEYRRATTQGCTRYISNIKVYGGNTR